VKSARRRNNPSWQRLDALENGRAASTRHRGRNNVAQLATKQPRDAGRFSGARGIVPFGQETSPRRTARGEVALRVGEDQLRKGNVWLAGSAAPTVADIACFPYIALAQDGGFYLGAYHSHRKLDRLDR
jgi:glutathione S-transferase